VHTALQNAMRHDREFDPGQMPANVRFGVSQKQFDRPHCPTAAFKQVNYIIFVKHGGAMA
jgi:hypothetical protein